MEVKDLAIKNEEQNAKQARNRENDWISEIKKNSKPLSFVDQPNLQF